MSDRFIPVAAPVLRGNERKYVLDCLDSTWISSTGKYVERFESTFAGFCNVKHASSCCNGTVALHLALLALNIGPGDEVLIPTLTFVATANTVVYCGARPVLVDSEPDTWNIDPSRIEEKITARTKAIIAVHLYGHPADMDPILEIAKRHNLFVIEDAAEAHGAEYKGRRSGSIGDIAIFSFYGNKVITTGEGGMVVTNNDELHRTVNQLKAQGTDPNRRYWFTTVGYNYRMTNITAAIGLAQLEQVDWHLQRRLEIARWYEELLRHPKLSFQIEQKWARHSHWMFNVLVDPDIDRDLLMRKLAEHNIETRPVFYPMHVLPPYRQPGSGEFPVADRIASTGISLPTWAGLSRDDVDFISKKLLDCISEIEDGRVINGQEITLGLVGR